MADLADSVARRYAVLRPHCRSSSGGCGSARRPRNWDRVGRHCRGGDRGRGLRAEPQPPLELRQMRSQHRVPPRDRVRRICHSATVTPHTPKTRLNVTGSNWEFANDFDAGGLEYTGCGRRSPPLADESFLVLTGEWTRRQAEEESATATGVLQAAGIKIVGELPVRARDVLTSFSGCEALRLRYGRSGGLGRAAVRGAATASVGVPAAVVGSARRPRPSRRDNADPPGPSSAASAPSHNRRWNSDRCGRSTAYRRATPESARSAIAQP